MKKPFEPSGFAKTEKPSMNWSMSWMVNSTMVQSSSLEILKSKILNSQKRKKGLLVFVQDNIRQKDEAYRRQNPVVNLSTNIALD